MRSWLLVLPLVLACSTSTVQNPTPVQRDGVRLEDVRAELTILAHDSMEGRRTGTPGSARAARYVASVMQEIGLEPAGDAGYLQRIPMVERTAANGRVTYTTMTQADLDSIPVSRRLYEANVVGVIRGSDPLMRDSAVVVGAHFDHLGIRPAPDSVRPRPDSIYNGADDDASGVIAVLEIARAMKRGPPPKRTVIFAAFTGEEGGGVRGSAYYILHPVIPMDRTVAQFQIEMIGRPDSMAGGFGKAWLTGYERSTMGDLLKERGIPIVPDPRPTQSFFTRSDNIRFARIGIPAHTLSTFNLHTDYHRPSDDVSKVDFPHMTALIGVAVQATRLLADGPAPAWKPGGRPQ
jgi:hypothetical protein